MRITNPPATTSAALAAILTDETGTGPVVLATSPTITTPILTTPTATGGTFTTPALDGETFSVAAAVTAGTNAQAQGALTKDINIVTTAASNPSGVTLPTATTGRFITIVNKGANPVNVYPASGGSIDALSANASIQIPVAGSMTFDASSTTQWYSSANGVFGSVAIGAGSATVAPLKLTSGTNNTTAAAGAVEFDGTCFYATAAASSRQVSDCEQFVTVQGSNFTLANNNTAQSPFAAANDVLQLAATTTYFFECLLYINTGATTHTTAMEFTASSAFTGIQYWAELWSTTAATISTTAPSVLDVSASTATVLNATSTATRTTIRCQGMIRTNASSTVTPKITFSADPTGTCATLINSFFRIWPVGINTVAAVGNWA